METYSTVTQLQRQGRTTCLLDISSKGILESNAVNFIKCTILTSALLLNSFGFAQSDVDLFHQGTAAYSQNQLDEASSHFLKFLKEHPDDARAHLNLSTIFIKQQKWGLAWAHFRKAHALNPHLQGIDLLQKKLNAHASPVGGLSGPYHSWVRPLISSMNQDLLLLIVLLAVTGFCHFLIRTLKAKKWAQEAEEAVPPTNWTTIALFIFSILGISTLLLQWNLSKQRYASIAVEQSLSVKSAPSEEGYEIGQLGGGIEIKVLRSQNNWTQITNESGTSGWAKSDSLLIYPGASQ